MKQKRGLIGMLIMLFFIIIIVIGIILYFKVKAFLRSPNIDAIRENFENIQEDREIEEDNETEELIIEINDNASINEELIIERQ